MLNRSLVAIIIFLSIPALDSKASTYLIDSDIVGINTYYTVMQEDNFYALARRYNIGIIELISANPGMDPWVPEPETVIKIPTIHILPEKSLRKDIVINLPELRLYYFQNEKVVMTFPIGIGREGWQTPVGKTKIIQKRKNPSWTPPQSIREENPGLPLVVPPGPDNPMGEYALSLALSGIAIHGTNRPYGIGVRSSHGCIRMYPEDIEQLFDVVNIGTQVTIIDQSYVLGWKNDILFLEVTPTQEQTDEIYEYKETRKLNWLEIYGAIASITGTEQGVDWSLVEKAIAEHSGTPIPIYQKDTLLK